MPAPISKKGTKADSMYQLFALIVEIDDIKGAGEIDSSMKSCIGMGSLLETSKRRLPQTNLSGMLRHGYSFILCI